MIDWDRVAELRSEFGEDGFAEVVSLFLEEADDAAQQIDGGLSRADLGNRLHFLKGLALNLGLQALAGLCQEGERMANNGGALPDMSRIVTCYRQSREAFVKGTTRRVA